MSKIKVDFPEDFLKRWLLATNRDNEKIDAETIEKELPTFLEDLKWQTIRNSIVKNNELSIEEADMIEYDKNAAKIQYMQYGLNSVPDKYLENYAMEMLEQEEKRREFADGAMHEKVISFIKEAVKLEEKEISHDEFSKLFEKN